MLAIVTSGHGAAPELPRLRGGGWLTESVAFAPSHSKLQTHHIQYCNRRRETSSICVSVIVIERLICKSVVDAAYCRHPEESQLSILATSGHQQLVQQQQQQAESCPHIYHSSQLYPDTRRWCPARA